MSLWFTINSIFIVRKGGFGCWLLLIYKVNCWNYCLSCLHFICYINNIMFKLWCRKWLIKLPKKIYKIICKLHEKLKYFFCFCFLPSEAMRKCNIFCCSFCLSDLVFHNFTPLALVVSYHLLQIALMCSFECPFIVGICKRPFHCRCFDM